ncbi:tetratricopeptide repeat protein [Pricia sp.]|uniref:tetratricopeptide repeat-containing sensor histidine kinase n=1 Tax=Pricia sp. TaxID=2268138 RepID=UPI0035938E72
MPLQAQRQEELDSLLTVLRTLPDDSSKIKTYYRLAWHYGSSNSETDIVRKYADSIKILSQKLNFEKGIGWYDFYYGVSSRHEGNYPEALVHLNKFIANSSSIGDSLDVANGLYQLAVIQSTLGEYDKALSVYHRILNIYQIKGKNLGVATALSSIGDIYLTSKKYDLAIESFKEALNLDDRLESGKPNQAAAVDLSYLGSAYLGKKEFSKSKNYYEQALKMSQEIGSDWGISNGLEDLGHVFIELKEYEKALFYYRRSLPIRERLSQKVELGYCFKYVGYTYLKLKNYLLAQNYLLKSLSVAEEIKSNPLISDVYEALSELHVEKKDFSGAYKYHQLFKAANDSILNERSTKHINELQVKYETEKKDQQITLLAQEKQVQQKEAQRQATLKNASIGGVGLIALLAGLIFYTLRQRLKGQKLLASKNEEIKEVNFKRQLTELEMKALQAQINPHFIFNCMNSINQMILDGDNQNASKYLTKFGKLIRMVLENAESTEVSLKDELTLLEAYIQLEALRFNGEIQHQIDVKGDIDLENTYLPSMVLQPFVENAIWHGLMHKKDTGNGQIGISIEQQGEQLICTIEDNGVGRQKAFELQQRSVYKTKSLGLKITEERLRLLSKELERQLIHITDLTNQAGEALGTRVTVNIPIS